jgi:MarR-like DNA-binding transcriptional regulator SgrR of sgrS sRNA
VASHVERWAREDRDDAELFERLTREDPELTAESLAEIARCSVPHMRKLLHRAKAGRMVKLPGTGRSVRVVKWSELLELKGDFELHEELFG